MRLSDHYASRRKLSPHLKVQIAFERSGGLQVLETPHLKLEPKRGALKAPTLIGRVLWWQLPVVTSLPTPRTPGRCSRKLPKPQTPPMALPEKTAGW